MVKPLLTFLKTNRSRVLRLLLYGLYAFFLLSSFYHVVYAKRVIPGVRLAGVSLSGKTEHEVSAILKGRLEREVSVTFKFNSEEFVFSRESLRLVYNVNDSVKKAFALGRTGNFVTDAKDKVAALVKGINLPPVYSFDKEALDKEISLIEGKVNIQSSDPVFLMNEGGDLVVSRAEKGRKVVRERMVSHIANSIASVSTENFTLPIEEIIPETTEADVMAKKGEVAGLLEVTPVIRYGTRVWNFSNQDILSFLAYRKDGNSVFITVSQSALARLAEDIASEVDAEARGEVFRVDGERVLEFRPKTDGKRVDKARLKKDFASALLGGGKDVALSVNESEAPGDTNKYGIYALLGEGVSYFQGSIPGRVTNITLAAQRSSGVLIPPGEVYSFNKVVGEITAQTGYDVAYIIKNGRTVLGEGGGVCQASTTLFRAILNAGLPIVKRTAHAYRVSYYEQKSEVGFDATVFNPTVDLQFKNDTPGYILVQADWDLSKWMLRYRIYGTPDGRTVEIGKPVVSASIAPAEPLYIDDPSIQKGRVVQVEYPAWGAVATVKRVVKRGGETIIEDTFVSRYQPWRAVFLKGTKT